MLNHCYFPIGGIWLTLRGKNVANDSYVYVEDIGHSEGDSNDSLLCHTDNIKCCESQQHGKIRKGEWYFPNGTEIKIRKNANYTSSYFYRDRGSQVVRLHRINNPPERGRFFCEIPDSSNEDQIIYVHIGKCIC